MFTLLALVGSAAAVSCPSLYDAGLSVNFCLDGMADAGWRPQYGCGIKCVGEYSSQCASCIQPAKTPSICHDNCINGSHDPNNTVSASRDWDADCTTLCEKIIPSLQENKGPYICPPTWCDEMGEDACRDGLLPEKGQWCGITNNATGCNKYDYNNPVCGPCREYIPAKHDEILQRIQDQGQSIGNALSIISAIAEDYGKYMES